MGVSLHYRGKLADIQQVKSICEELTHIATSMNSPWVSMDEDWSQSANARVTATEYGTQIVGHLPLKGIQFTPNPACEPLRFLFDSEGNLRDPMSMTMILEGSLELENAWISVKTQFSSPETHVWIVGLLKYLKMRYIPDLEVSDEGDYWETGNLETLKEKMALLADKTDMITNELSSTNFGDMSGCSAEEIASMIEQLLRNKLDSNEINRDSAQ